MTLDDRFGRAREQLNTEADVMDVPENNTPARSRRRSAQRTTFGVVSLLLVIGISVVAISGRQSSTPPIAGTPEVGPFVGDTVNPANPHNKDSHWHAALGVYDCDHWLGDSTGEGIWNWPAQTPQGSPARKNQPGVYAGLHSHDDGIIHMEPATEDDAGANAIVGRYFNEGGWGLAADGYSFLGTTRHNGDRCGNAAGELAWWVNGRRHTGTPATYKLMNDDDVVIAFLPADANYPGNPPSLKNLPDTARHAVPAQNSTTDLEQSPRVGMLSITAGPNGRLAFSPRELSAHTGVYLIVVKAGTGGHTFEFADPTTQGRRLVLSKTGATQSMVVIFEKAGDYVFYDAIPGHRAAGMQGVVHVTGPTTSLEQIRRDASLIQPGPNPSTPPAFATPTTLLLGTSANGKPCVAVTQSLPPGAPAVPVQVGPAPTKLVIKDLKIGTGALVGTTSKVNVKYVGAACSSGEIFDSSYERNDTFPLELGQGQVIDGWEKGIPGMRVGGRRLLGIPATQAYGSAGSPPKIDPDEALWFVVDAVSMG